MTVAARVTCTLCPEAARRALIMPAGDTLICDDCGKRYRAPRVYRVDPDAPAPERTPLARAGAAASALSVTDADRELARVRSALVDLRPDHPDPWEPMPKAAEAVPTVRVRDPQAQWGGIPRGLASPLGAQLAAAEAASRCAADVLREIGALPPDAAAVLRWLRREASLAEGLRGLWYAVGMAFASAAQSEAWEDLTVRRGFAPAHGRRLVLAALTAWERRS